MGGCAVLAARACLRSGVGKVVLHVSESLVTVVMTAVPEAVVSVGDESGDRMLSATFLQHFDAIAIGPGIGTGASAVEKVQQCLTQVREDVPQVIDADALNVLSQQADWPDMLPQKSVLTPHLGELSRLAHAHLTEKLRLDTAIKMARLSRSFLIAKGHPTYVVSPEGAVSANTTGTDAIATAGSGDVLTGILAGLLAQGYTPEDASRLGVFLHGLAGDIAASKLGHHSVVASDIVDSLPEAFLLLKKHCES